jgi:hypothetical protein
MRHSSPLCAPATGGQRQTAHDHERQRVWLGRCCCGGTSDVVKLGRTFAYADGYGGEFEWPSLARISANVGTINVVSFSKSVLAGGEYNKRQAVSVK